MRRKLISVFRCLLYIIGMVSCVMAGEHRMEDVVHLAVIDRPWPFPLHNHKPRCILRRHVEVYFEVLWQVES